MDRRGITSRYYLLRFSESFQKVPSSAVFSVLSMTLTSQIVHVFSHKLFHGIVDQYVPPISFHIIGMRTLLICKCERTFMAVLLFDFGIGCSFGFGFCGFFFDSCTPCTAIMRHLLPLPLVDIDGMEVLLCAVHVA